MTTFTNFTDVAAALGFKVKAPAKAETKVACPECGQELRNIAGTNVWLCDWAALEERKLKDNVEVQVFTPCRARLLA